LTRELTINRRLEDVDFSVSILSRSKVINNLLKNQYSEKSSVFFANLRFLFFSLTPREPATTRDRIAIYKTTCQRYGRADTAKEYLATTPAMDRPKKITIQASHGFHFITRRTPA
jgi:hypothetical protein